MTVRAWMATASSRVAAMRSMVARERWIGGERVQASSSSRERLKSSQRPPMPGLPERKARKRDQSGEEGERAATAGWAALWALGWAVGVVGAGRMGNATRGWWVWRPAVQNERVFAHKPAL